MTVFWDVVPCSPVEIDRRFRGANCFHHQGDELAAREKLGSDMVAGRTISPDRAQCSDSL
jgi:hypothetical protein